MASKRPSLAESMRTLATSGEPQVVALRPEPARTEPIQETKPAPSGAKPFYAATRAGKKKVTAALAPSAHKQLKSLAVENETTTEALLNEAISDLFAKYNRASVA
jgi:hypothetical protein